VILLQWIVVLLQWQWFCFYDFQRRLYIYCVDLFMWSPTKWTFYFMIFLWFNMVFQTSCQNN
jgi:hypothetical protein